MTASELRDLLEHVQVLLEKNQGLATPALLSLLEEGVGKLQALPALQALVASFLDKQPAEIAEVLRSLKEGIGLERELVKPEVTGRIIQILERLKDRPLVLRAIALVL